ncbi:MAG: Gfo/Idh/MocA family oxidoreductase [Bacteroidota bacterium]
MNRRDDQPMDTSRRSFLKKSSLAPLAGFLGVSQLTTDYAAAKGAPFIHTGKRTANTINCAIIGFGPQGRDIAEILTRFEETNVVAVCDTFNLMLRRAKRSLPDAAQYADYREVLASDDVQAVFITTPTHQHKDITIAALEAGKHVYVEAPMANTIEDAEAMAKAARAVEGDQVFQVGQLLRYEPQYRSVYQFMRSGALGKPVMARMQAHGKESWRRTSSRRERETELNWRLDADVSLGLTGEKGLHQWDVAMWVLDELPSSISGFGNIMFWDDGRAVPDVVQTVLRFPSGFNLMYDASLVSSYEGTYEIFRGSDSTIMFRDQHKAWMFKEVDAPMLGWEVYARKDKFYKEKGIALLANATQLDSLHQDATYDDPNAETPLYWALRAFVDNYSFGPYPAQVGYNEGYIGTVIAVKANEAVMGNTTVEIAPSMYQLS